MSGSIKRNPRRKAVKGESGRKQPVAKAVDGTQDEKKKPRSRLRKTLIILSASLGALLVIGGIFLVVLFGRISRPGTYAFGPVEETPVPTPSSNIAAAPQQETPKPATPPPAVATPEPLPADGQNNGDDAEPDDALDAAMEFAALPLADLFPQTELSAAQKAAMQAQNENKTEYTHILLVGVDRRGTRGDSNADTIMIATLDKKNKRLKLTSILRDCYVPIEGFGVDRINSSASHGGIPLLMHTVNSMLSLDITNYVLVDFRMFENIIDKMGGVGLRMTEQEIAAANDNIAGLNKQRGAEYLWDGFIFANPGSVRCTGQQALAYARIRKIDSDFSRTNRQFKVLNAIYAKFRSKNLAQQTALLYDLLPMVETDLSPVQIMDIALSALSMDVAGLQHERIPFDGYYKGGSVNRKYAIVMDMPMNAWKTHRFMYLFEGLPEEAQVYTGGPSLPPRTPSPTLPPEEEWWQPPEMDQFPIQ